MGTEQVDLSGVSAEDADILNHQLNGVESEKEAADVRVSRMLKEEADAGRGKEQFELDDEDEGEQVAKTDDEDGEQVAKTADEPSEADKLKARQEEETRSQKRARLRRETIQRAQSDRDRLQREVGRLQERLKAVEARNPDPDAYGDDTPTYVADRAGYAASHIATADQLEDVKAQANAADATIAQQKAESVADYFAEGNRKYPDFQKTIVDNAGLFTADMADSLIELDMFDVAYELAKRPEEAARIAALGSPALRTKEMIQMQASLQSKAADRTITRAPPPIKPIRAAGAPATKRLEELPNAEYFALRKQQMASKR